MCASRITQARHLATLVGRNSAAYSQLLFVHFCAHAVSLASSVLPRPPALSSSPSLLLFVPLGCFKYTTVRSHVRSRFLTRSLARPPHYLACSPLTPKESRAIKHERDTNRLETTPTNANDSARHHTTAQRPRTISHDCVTITIDSIRPPAVRMAPPSLLARALFESFARSIACRTRTTCIEVS